MVIDQPVLKWETVTTLSGILSASTAPLAASTVAGGNSTTRRQLQLPLLPCLWPFAFLPVAPAVAAATAHQAAAATTSCFSKRQPVLQPAAARHCSLSVCLPPQGLPPPSHRCFGQGLSGGTPPICLATEAAAAAAAAAAQPTLQ